MTTISPTRVSMYDFLLQDMQPMVSLLADVARLSLPQTRLCLSASLQAIVTALLAYEQRHQASTIQKKLFTRAAVKELRQYNAVNFATINASLYLRNDITDAIFGDAATVMRVCAYIAAQTRTSTAQVKTLLTSSSLIALRELAILADYSKLDHDELAKWFTLQPQFLQVAAIDDYWYELTGFQPAHASTNQEMQPATSNYLKVIGRTDANVQQGQHNDLLVFATMPSIALPHRRWLLQLAKIADIYLSRNRLRITSEPAAAPTAPVVSSSLFDDHKEPTPVTASEPPIEHDRSMPLWKDPVILIIILVIASLSALAALKHQKQQSNGVLPAAAAVYKHDHPEAHQQQDVAIVKVDGAN